MSVLNVVDRILFRLFFGEIEIEFEMTLRRAHQQEVAHHIRAHFMDQLI